MKSPPGQQPEFIPLGVECLHAPHVGGHQADDCVEQPVIQDFDVALLNEQGADFLQSQRVVQFGHLISDTVCLHRALECGNAAANSRLPSSAGNCRREVFDTFSECI